MAKLIVGFRQMQQVQLLNKNHEDLSLHLIDTYDLDENAQYLNSKKYRLYCKNKTSFFRSHSLPWVKFPVYTYQTYDVFVLQMKQSDMSTSRAGLELNHVRTDISFIGKNFLFVAAFTWLPSLIDH